MRLLIGILLILFCLLQYRLWFGQYSVTDYLQRLDEIATQRASNQELQKRNRMLLADVTDLQQGLEAIEERARNELGLIGEHEVFFRIVQTEGQQDAPKGEPWARCQTILLPPLYPPPGLANECRRTFLNNIYP